MSQGLSIANNLLANTVQYNLDNNQSALRKLVTHLSSGLRISSAADDPSGLAIATNLQTQAAGFNTAVQNVQNANNAAQVALGALTTTTDILQRIRSLAVEASSDLTSNSDRANLQSEVSQLLLELNSISQHANFNGQPLLDGSHAGFQPEQNATVTITANSALANAAPVIVPGAGSGSPGVVSNGNFANPPVAANRFINNPIIPGWTTSGIYAVYDGAPFLYPPLAAGQQAFRYNSPGTATTTITGLTAGQQYQVTFSAANKGTGTIGVVVNGSNVNPSNIGTLNGTYQNFTSQTFTASGTTATLAFNNAGGPAFFTNVAVIGVGSGGSGSTSVSGGYLAASVTATNANFNTTAISTLGYATTPGGNYGTVDGTIELHVVNTGVSVAAQETFINSATGAISVDPTLYGAGQTSADFENLNITLGSFGALDIGTTAFIKVGQNVAALTNPNNPAFNFQTGANEGDVIQIGIGATNTQTLRVSNINLALSSPGNASLGAEDAIGQIDIALQNVLKQQALLGSVVVRLNEDASNDSIAAVNLKSSESSIRDLNVGQATTEFTKLQVLIQVGTSVLSQSKLNAQSVLGLFR